MTVIRNIGNTDTNATNYIASLVLISGLATTVLMLKFRGFKASLNFGSSKKRHDLEYFPSGTESISVNGAYRKTREEFFGYGTLSEPPKRIDASMVILPPNQAKFEYQNPLDLQPKLKSSKSTNDLNEPSANIPVHLGKSTPNVSSDPRGGSSSYRNSTDSYRNDEPKKTATDKEHKLFEKKQEKIKNISKGVTKPDNVKAKVAKTTVTNSQNAFPGTSNGTDPKPVETKDIKQKKFAPQPKDNKEQKRIEKELKKQKALEDKLLKEKQKAEKKKKKAKSPEQPQKPPRMPVPAQRSNPLAQSTGYSTNTLESSISRTTGPPAYSDVSDKVEVIPNKSDDTGNTSFGKKIDEKSSWDMVSMHRQQMGGESRPGLTERKPKRMVMDLNYNVGDAGSSNEVRDNSEA